MYDELPQRVSGTNLPPAAYRAVGVAKVLCSGCHDENLLTHLLETLREWAVNEPPVLPRAAR